MCGPPAEAMLLGMTTATTARKATTPDLERLRESVHGPVLAPGDEAYDEARSVWNAMIDRRPAAIVRCSGTADVLAAVRFAREHDLLVAVRGGGHNVAGVAVCDGGLVIDLSRLRGASVDPAARVARVQPGATWADLDHETQAFGLAVPGGLVSMTGVAGFTLGGGIGWLTRRYGFAADSLIAADLVTADGEYLRVDEHQHPELLWGLRGGGGNFGVVSSFEFRLHEAGPTVFAGPRAWPMERAPEVLRCFRELKADAPDELTMLAILRIAPPAPWIPPEYHGKPVVVLVTCYSGELEAGPEAVALMDELGPPIADALGPMPYVRIQRFFDGAWQDGFQNYWKAEYLAGLPDEAIETVTERAAQITSPLSDVKLLQMGGAASRIEDHTALAHRHAPLNFNINARWANPAESEAHIDWTFDLWEAMRPHSAGGAYVNFLGQEGGNRVRAAYGEKFDRLVALKDRYDPHNFFRMNQNIPPSQ
jgi:FAD/FMN-containing dehydrogenase